MPVERLRDELFARTAAVASYPLVTLGRTPVTLVGLVTLLALCWLIVAAQQRFQRHVVGRALRRTHLDPALQYTVGQVTGYAFISLGFYTVLQVVGIDLTSLAVLAGAVGVGVGFGLQHVISNFISGVIILAERPIAVGDRVEVGGVAGQVTRISLRSTTVVTNDNIAIIVPNATFITNSVTNWSHGDPRVRFRIPVLVAHGSDVDLVRELLLGVAAAHPQALREPAPSVFLNGLGEAGLSFELGVWTLEMAQSPRRFRSDLNLAIERALRQHGVGLPVPQREVRLVQDGRAG